MVVSGDNNTNKILSFIYIFYVDSTLSTLVYILFDYVAATMIVPLCLDYPTSKCRIFSPMFQAEVLK